MSEAPVETMDEMLRRLREIPCNGGTMNVQWGVLRSLCALALAADEYENIVAVDGRDQAELEYAKLANAICTLRNTGILQP